MEGKKNEKNVFNEKKIVRKILGIVFFVFQTD